MIIRELRQLDLGLEHLQRLLAHLRREWVSRAPGRDRGAGTRREATEYLRAYV